MHDHTVTKLTTFVTNRCHYVVIELEADIDMPDKDVYCKAMSNQDGIGLIKGNTGQKDDSDERDAVRMGRNVFAERL